MKTIPLTQGLVALVDDADFEAVAAFQWCALKKGNMIYARRNTRKPDGTRTMEGIHQFLMPEALLIDHRDGNGLNNQRHNLRSATHQQNMQGFKCKRAGATSKFRGVSWAARVKRFQAQLRTNGRLLYLGYFHEESDAARAYDKAARQHFGEFAHLNFP